MKTVTIVGLGYIGLPTALVAAEHGYHVQGYDINEKHVAAINNRQEVIKEPNIQEKLHHALSLKRLSASTECKAADYFIIAVPTPFKEEKKADLSYVWSALKTIAGVIKKGDVIIIESTIPVGTTQQAALFLEQETSLHIGIDIFLAHCPERVLPGKIFHELVHNDRIIGGINLDSVHQAKLFYQEFVKGNLYLTNATTAEMVKLVENSSRDVAIAFANEVADMAQQAGLNPFEVIALANKHPRVSILNPSCGVGGHCIAVDPWFLIETFPQETALIKQARLVNDTKPHKVLHDVHVAVQAWQKAHNTKPTVLCLGLAYKANIDDLRESPALEIATNLLHDDQLTLLVCEPNIKEHALFPLIDFEDGIKHADIILCLVAHNEFKLLQSQSLANTTIIDTCGLLYKQPESSNELLFWPAHTDEEVSSLHHQPVRSSCNETTVS